MPEARLLIRLLGAPSIEREGEPIKPPRGRKPWAVLAYMALAERPVPRTRLAELVFSDAADPLGALRWTLAELRRALDLPAALQGDPLRLNLPAEAAVDVDLLAAGSPQDIVRGELLEGVEPRAEAAFEAWLLIARRRLAGACVGVLHDAALDALAGGDPAKAVAFAERGLELDRLDENMNELVVRCLAACGDPEGAIERAEACERLFLSRLGRLPDSRVRRAAHRLGTEDPAAIGDRAAALGQLEAGTAAIAAGAVDPGLACLRQAAAEARALDDPSILRRTLFALGAALVHAVRGRDEEAAALLHEARVMARRGGDAGVEGRACRELGFVDVQAGRTASAGRWLQRASELTTDDADRAAVLGIRGMALSDRAHYRPAIELLGESAEVAAASGDDRQRAWSLALLARAQLLIGALSPSLGAADESLALVDSTGWVAFQPLPEAVKAEVVMREGREDRAEDLLGHAFSLSCRLGDPCWEALAARARGLLSRRRGDERGADAQLRDAAVRANRVPDAYAWIHAHCLDALAGHLADPRPGEVEAAVDELDRIAGRGDMREMIVRSALHRARLGDPAAIEAARDIAAAIDNPVLDATFGAVAG